MYDSNGKKIFFSTIFEPDLNNDYIKKSEDDRTNVRLFNGQWKYYGSPFIASGDGYETFTLTGLQSDSSREKYVANGQIEVFVRPAASVVKGTYDGIKRWQSD